MNHVSAGRLPARIGRRDRPPFGPLIARIAVHRPSRLVALWQPPGAASRPAEDGFSRPSPGGPHFCEIIRGFLIKDCYRGSEWHDWVVPVLYQLPPSPPGWVAFYFAASIGLCEHLPNQCRPTTAHHRYRLAALWQPPCCRKQARWGLTLQALPRRAALSRAWLFDIDAAGRCEHSPDWCRPNCGPRLVWACN
jgi:hypothetical protein